MVVGAFIIAFVCDLLVANVLVIDVGVGCIAKDEDVGGIEDGDELVGGLDYIPHFKEVIH